VRAYGIRVPADRGTGALAYLRDRVLAERLVTAAGVVRAHLAGSRARPIPLAELMGSQIDALKLVSSMTMFGHVAKTLHAAETRPQFASMAAHADAILAAAPAQRYARCSCTEAQLG